MTFVYLLHCADGSFYVGHTNDLSRRLREHQAGLGAVHAANRLPVEMVYAEEYATAARALKCERQLKHWSHRKKEALVAGDLCALKSA